MGYGWLEMFPWQVRGLGRHQRLPVSTLEWGGGWQFGEELGTLLFQIKVTIRRTDGNGE